MYAMKENSDGRIAYGTYPEFAAETVKKPDFDAAQTEMVFTQGDMIHTDEGADSILKEEEA